MKEVRLIKPWGPRKAGELVEVDDQRADTLIAGGLAREAVLCPVCNEKGCADHERYGRKD